MADEEQDTTTQTTRSADLGAEKDAGAEWDKLKFEFEALRR